jgi:anaerobic magnesium-protoporphyrin IX monomethyl ester cyclase
MAGGVRIALLGPMQQDNLPLGYLASAAKAAGHRPTLVRFDGAAHKKECVDAVLRLDPEAVGLALPFQLSVTDGMDLVAALRAQGYRGHVTCGGHVATFCYEALLEGEAGLDSAVRHEGEETLVALLDALAQGKEPRDIPGLAWRDGGRAVCGPKRGPVAELDALPWPARRQSALGIGGAKLAFILTSRGCIGECAYCSIRAFNRDMGGPRFRLRRPEAIADEVAHLYHRLGVRVFCAQDDLFILPDEDEAVSRMNAITTALRARAVGGDALFWIKGRPETITAPVVDAACAMGAVHMFLGVESASNARLAYLGRRHVHADNERAIRLCSERDLKPSFNLMLFDPDCTLEEVRESVDFAAAHTEIPWNVCRTEIYPGTRLCERLSAEGRLRGGLLGYQYQMRDTRAELMFRAMRVAFHERAFAASALQNRLITLSFARQVQERLLPGPATDALSRRVDALNAEVRRDTVEELRRLATYCDGADPANAGGLRDHAIALAIGIQLRDNEFLERFETLWTTLNERGEILLGGGERRSADAVSEVTP